MKQNLAAQLVRYGLVGGAVYFCDLVVFALIIAALPASHLPANVAGRLAGAALGFVLHRQFTFSWPQRDGKSRQAVAYSALLLANIAASSLLLWLAVDQAGIDAFIARVAVDFIVIAVAFLAGRHWVYRPA